jgi:hypothetical protein
MSDKHQTPAKPTAVGTPLPNPTDKSATQTDDQARRDGGKTTDNKWVNTEQREKIEEKALDHTKEEPGS